MIRLAPPRRGFVVYNHLLLPRQTPPPRLFVSPVRLHHRLNGGGRLRPRMQNPQGTGSVVVLFFERCQRVKEPQPLSCRTKKNLKITSQSHHLARAAIFEGLGGKTGRRVSHLIFTFGEKPSASSKKKSRDRHTSETSLPPKGKSARFGIPQAVIEANAHPGESYEDAALRLLEKRKKTC